MAEKKLTSRARTLGQNSTDAERLLWSRLRSRQLGEKFVRQLPVGPYVVDFACRSARLAVELDGGQHAVAIEADQTRASAIEASGYRLIRFWNNDVLTNIDGVLSVIQETIETARNRPPSQIGGDRTPSP